MNHNKAIIGTILMVMVIGVWSQTISVPLNARPSSTRMGTNVGSRPSRVTDPVVDDSTDDVSTDGGNWGPGGGHGGGRPKPDHGNKGCEKCKDGEQGPPGPQGVTGPTGPTGPAGEPGFGHCFPCTGTFEITSTLDPVLFSVEVIGGGGGGAAGSSSTGGGGGGAGGVGRAIVFGQPGFRYVCGTGRGGQGGVISATGAFGTDGTASWFRQIGAPQGYTANGGSSPTAGLASPPVVAATGTTGVGFEIIALGGRGASGTNGNGGAAGRVVGIHSGPATGATFGDARSDDGRALATRRDGDTGASGGNRGGNGGDNTDAFGGAGGVSGATGFNGEDGQDFGAGGGGGAKSNSQRAQCTITSRTLADDGVPTGGHDNDPLTCGGDGGAGLVRICM